MDVSGHVRPELDTYLERMRPIVDDAIQKLGAAQFREDPIAGRRYSRATSIFGSAYKRHGTILSRAIIERLRDCARLRVWADDDFKLSHESLREIRTAERLDSLMGKDLRYGERERSVRIDIVAFDEESKTLSAYAVKRGNGSYDGGKRRIILEELTRISMLLADYGRAHGFDASTSRVHIIFYYGLLSLPRPIALSGDELDGHFGFAVRGAVEEVNAYFVELLHDLVEQEQ